MDGLLEVETSSDSMDQLQHSDKEVRKGEHLLVCLCARDVGRQCGGRTASETQGSQHPQGNGESPTRNVSSV